MVEKQSGFFPSPTSKIGGEINVQKDYLDNLTALRGIASLFTVAFHSDMFLKEIVEGKTTMLIKNGWLWVDFFFVLSGFIISYKYSELFFKRVTAETFFMFLRRRFARLYPLHMVTLIATCILVLVIDSKAVSLSRYMKEMLNLDSIPAHLLLIQALHLYPTPTLNTSSWSLSTEWWVYMLFPFITLLIPKTETAWSKLTAFLLVAVCYLGLILIVGSSPGKASQNSFIVIVSRSLSVTADWGILRCAAGFFWGMVISRLFANKDFCRLLGKDYMCFLLLLITLFGLHFDINGLFVVFLFGVIVLALAYNDGSVAQMLQWSPFQTLGKLSFSIYLTHVPVIFAFWIWILDFRQDALLFPGIVGASIKLSGIAVFMAMTAITIVVSTITYRFVELPGRKHLT